MSRESPEAVFEHARAAMSRGEMTEVFACLDVNDLKKIAENAVNLSIGFGPPAADGMDAMRAICRTYGFPLDDVLAARDRLGTSKEATMAHRDALKRGLASVSDLPRFLGALEGYCRTRYNRGSVSTRLFQDETLLDVRVDGSRATGTRKFSETSSEPVEFVRRKGEWFVRLIARSR
jgi:hypothetical protein